MFLCVKFWALTYSQGELLGLRKKALAGEPSPPGSPGASCPFGETSGEALAILSGRSPQTEAVPVALQPPPALLSAWQRRNIRGIALGTLESGGQTETHRDPKQQ